MKKNKVGLKQSLELERAITYLQSLAENMRAGTVCVREDDRFLELKPKSRVFLQVKARRKRDRSKLSLTISWNGEEPDGRDFGVSEA